LVEKATVPSRIFTHLSIWERWMCRVIAKLNWMDWIIFCFPIAKNRLLYRFYTACTPNSNHNKIHWLACVRTTLVLPLHHCDLGCLMTSMSQLWNERMVKKLTSVDLKDSECIKESPNVKQHLNLRLRDKTNSYELTCYI